jgi:uncharacterized protein YyaL (SSP411 family)
MANALQHETSPYLLQHRDNPVDWLPWGPEALERARRSGKPILLSIGYSACHWCHVMAHESFEDEATAALMNEHFVNIKVDREERPDLDRIYQSSQQLLTGRAGGWPLTVFLTPAEQWPFFAGTYFPKQQNYGMPAFSEVLRRVAEYFHRHRSEIDSNAWQLLDALSRSTEATEHRLEPDDGFRQRARQRLGKSFDAANGGFGGAPKFPHSAELGLLLRLAPGDAEALGIVTTTLTSMAGSGLFDHLGGGFYRYCVDAEWRIPHFEKMLYDNAALLGLYAEAHAITGDALYANAASATAAWLLADMRHADGAFFSTRDADSEGEEGKYYCFTQAEFEAALDLAERAAAGHYFGLDAPPNFEGHAWHLQPREQVLPFGAAAAEIESARTKLLTLRSARTAPARDEKILTSWNGLLIANLARAARRLTRPDLGEAAAAAVDFIRAKLWQDGRLKATWKDGRARFAGYLDDYALLAAGLVELMQWRFRAEDLGFAVDLAEALLAHFSDPNGGFYFTASDHETLIHRPKSLADEALPSGNGNAALVLDTLGHLLGEPRYLEAAVGTVRAALPNIAQYPEAHASLLHALDRQLAPPTLLVVRGPQAMLSEWQAGAESVAVPERLSFFIADDAGALPGLLATREATGEPVAYLCPGTSCEAPIDSLAELQARLQDQR